jgi:hypothetical protein
MKYAAFLGLLIFSSKVLAQDCCTATVNSVNPKTQMTNCSIVLNNKQKPMFTTNSPEACKVSCGTVKTACKGPGEPYYQDDNGDIVYKSEEPNTDEASPKDNPSTQEEPKKIQGNGEL